MNTTPQISEAAKRAANDIYHHRESGDARFEPTPVVEIIERAITSCTAPLEQRIAELFSETERLTDQRNAQQEKCYQLKDQLAARSLAERCYNEDRADEELCHAILKIIGDTFADFWTDGYDGSVEIVMSQGNALTRENADAILALGFGQIYESRIGEMKGVNWLRGRVQECSPRESDEDRSTIVKLSQKLAAREATIAELRKALIAIIDRANGASFPMGANITALATAALAKCTP